MIKSSIAANEVYAVAVYYSDRALRLGLPPRAHFSKSSASPLVLRLLKSARLMLQYEQQRMQRGGREDGQKLIHELTGEQKDLFPLFSTDASNW